MAKKIKLTDTFETIGAFWNPATPDEKITGTVAAKNGKVSLSTAPNYSPTVPEDMRKIFAAIGTKPLPRINSLWGFTREGDCSLFEAIALNGDHFTDPTNKQKVTNEHYQVSAAVFGMHVDSLEAKQVNGAGFFLTKIHRMLPTPWVMNWKNDGTSYNSPHKAVEVFKFRSESLDAEIICEVLSGGETKFKKKATVKTVPRVRVLPASAQSLEWYIDVASRIENFFALILGTSISLKRFQLFKDDKVGWVVYKTLQRDQKFNISKCIKCDSHMLSSALDKWLAVPDEKRPVEKTLLGMLRKTSVHAETEFLGLAQALEGFSRIRVSSDKKFRWRLDKISEMLTSEFADKLIGKKDDFVNKVVSTRNFYTHLGLKADIPVVQDWGELFLLNQQLQALIRCVMLIQLGIDESILHEPILYQSKMYQPL